MADIADTPPTAAEQPDSQAAGAQQPAQTQGGQPDPDPPQTAAPAGEERKRSLGAEEASIAIKVTFGKQSMTTSRPLLSTVADLKADIATHTGIPPENQKLLFKGQLKDEQTLQAAGLKTGSKVIVMGSRPEEIKVTALGAAGKAAGSSGGGSGGGDWADQGTPSQPWSEQEQHKKVLSKGRPEDGWPGLKDKQVPLRDDQAYIPGLYNSQGTKVRLTFKTDLQQLWVGSAASTQKVPFNTITKIESQPIEGQPEYSILRIQVGASATSNIWLYYVPSQAVSGVKMRVLGVSALL